MFVRMFDKTCAATHESPTANGPVEVRCTKKPDHVAKGDLQHEGKVGVFPVRWPDQPTTA